MFSSFMFGAIFIYLFHIFQSSVTQRCHITSVALLTAWLANKAEDQRTNTFWKCLSIWVIYSNLFFDMHTHWLGWPQMAKHALLSSMPYLITKSFVHKLSVQLFFWSLVVGVPDICSNVYGNAIMSEIKLFLCCVLIMARFRKRSIQEALVIENYLWVLFIHDSLVWLAFLQAFFDLKHKKQTKNEYIPEKDIENVVETNSKKKRRVINEDDLKMFNLN